MKIKRLLFAFLMILAGCGKDSPKPDDNEKPVPIPGAALLVAPIQNQICATGTILSDTTVAITFNWGGVTGANSYYISIRNLLNNQVIQTGINTTAFTTTLKRNTPYSWHVTTTTSSSAVVSEEWKFYVAGLAATTYAPYPAEVISPKQGESFYAFYPQISLSWKGSAISNNITGFDLYFGTSNNPPLLQTDLSPYNSSYTVNIEPGKTYYWRVITKDTNGNTSASQLFQFDSR